MKWGGLPDRLQPGARLFERECPGEGVECIKAGAVAGMQGLKVHPFKCTGGFVDPFLIGVHQVQTPDDGADTVLATDRPGVVNNVHNTGMRTAADDHKSGITLIRDRRVIGDVIGCGGAVGECHLCIRFEVFPCMHPGDLSQEYQAIGEPDRLR